MPRRPMRFVNVYSNCADNGRNAKRPAREGGTSCATNPPDLQRAIELHQPTQGSSEMVGRTVVVDNCTQTTRPVESQSRQIEFTLLQFRVISNDRSSCANLSGGDAFPVRKSLLKGAAAIVTMLVPIVTLILSLIK